MRSCRLTRRGALAAGAALVVPLAGCTRVSEFLVDRFTGQVNLFNTSDLRLTGSLELVDPRGEVLLDEAIALAPGSDGEEGEPAATYENVLTSSGSHELTLALDATDRTGAMTVAETLPIEKPDEERVVVFLGEELTGQFVTVTVVEDFAELDEVIEE